MGNEMDGTPLERLDRSTSPQVTVPLSGRYGLRLLCCTVSTLLLFLFATPSVSEAAQARATADTTHTAAQQQQLFELSQPGISTRRLSAHSGRHVLDVILGLNPRLADLASLVQAESDPTSPSYRRYKSPSWLDQHFGASKSSQREVIHYLSEFGVRGVVDPSGSFVEAKMTLGQASRIFATTFAIFRSPTSGIDLWGAGSGGRELQPVRPARLPATLQGRVNLVAGLDTPLSSANPYPGYLPATQATADPPSPSGTPKGCLLGTDGGYTPNEISAAYGLDPLVAQGLDGQGVVVDLLEFRPARASDLDTYARCFGMPDPHFSVYKIGVGPDRVPSTADVRGETEATLDAELVDALAPRLQNIHMFVDEGPDRYADLLELFAEPLAELPHPQAPQIVSLSGGFCELESSGIPRTINLVERLLMEEDAAGITVAVSAGDQGSTGCRPPVENGGIGKLSTGFPASSPYVTAVGGTQLQLDASNRIKSETVWNDLPYGQRGSGGGGQSSWWSRPWYQSGLTLQGDHRLVPDVSFDADLYPGYSFYFEGSWSGVGGTSASAPVFAGGMAIIDQSALRGHQEALGFANPLIYSLARIDPSAFSDVTVGSNDVYNVGCCSAVPAMTWLRDGARSTSRSLRWPQGRINDLSSERGSPACRKS
jgi:kumamolisin